MDVGGDSGDSQRAPVPLSIGLAAETVIRAPKVFFRRFTMSERPYRASDVPF